MGLGQEYAELLSGFEKRMRFINIAKYLLSYSYKDSIRNMIPDRDVLDNLIIAVLVFIKDRTLGDVQNCRLDDVADFLEALSIVMPASCGIDSAELARFIVVDVLQKGGLLTDYSVLVPDKECFERMPVRLIEEERGMYHLTDDAFDFLFRSKEIESELDYSVTRFRMAEYMKRDNYTEALDQSRELVSRIRNMKVSMDDFLRRCRENIAKISVDQYDTVITRVRDLLETEYEELRIIQDQAKIRAERLSEAEQTGVASENYQKHRKALWEIIRNIQLTIEEQRGLINRKLSLSEEYQRILRDSYAMNRYERLHFDKDILSLLRNGTMPLDTASVFLLFPLTRHELESRFSIENLYSFQQRLLEPREGEPEALDDETEEVDPMEQRNQRFLSICSTLFAFMVPRTSFKISEFVASLQDGDLFDYCEENALPQVVLNLYAMQSVSVSAWKESQEIIILPLGEFELSWCLSEMPEQYRQLDSFTVTKLEREFSFTVERDGRQNRISMTDFLFEVKK